MQLHSINRATPRKKKKTVGRGGKRGTYSGRGIKGQNARSGHRKRPELRDTIKKIPRLRGVSVNGPQYSGAKVPVVNLSAIEKAFSTGEKVTPQTLIEKKVLRLKKGKLARVKILGSGTLSKRLTFSGVLVAQSAHDSITKAGGTVLA